MKYPAGIKEGSLVSIGDLRKGDVFQFTFGIEKLFNIHGNYEVEVDYNNSEPFARIFARKWGTEETVEMMESRDKTFLHIKAKYYDKRKTIPYLIKVIFIRKGR